MKKLDATSFKFNKNKMVFAQCYARGFADIINQMLSENTTIKGKVKKLDEGIAEIRLDYKTNGNANYIDLLKKYPQLKYCGLIEIPSEEMVYAIYSESGSNGLTVVQRAGEYDVKSDSMSQGRWAHSGDITKTIKIDFIHHSTDSRIKDKYEFPFQFEWNNNDFAVEQKGEFIHPAKDSLKVLVKGKYVEYNEADDFEIKDNELIKYKGRALVVKIPDGVTKIALGAFGKCKGINRVIIPGSCKTICGGEDGRGFFSVFDSGDNVELVLSEGVESIENVSYFSNVKKLCLPSTLKKIEFSPNSYYGMTGIEEIDIAGNDYFEFQNGLLFNKKKDAVYFAKKDIAEINITEPEISIYPGAFSGVHGFKNIIIPKSITVIPARCFCDCDNLETIEGGENIKEIHAAAFNGCAKLKVIPLPKTLESVDRSAFFFCNAIPKSVVKKFEKFYVD